MSNGLDIPFDRVTYRDGQKLTARDLGDDVRRDSRLRWLHTQTLHATWGIALGFGVSLAQGKQGVVVSPGYAVDSYGRDLVLAEGIHLPMPNVIGPAHFVLTVSYQEDTEFRTRRDLVTLCSSGLDLRNERPTFSWQRSDEARFGVHVPLVCVAVVQGTVQGELDFRVRRNAHPLARPHIGLGATEPGRTGWELWQEQGQANLGLQLTVDTSEAGFVKTPAYFALLHTTFDSGMTYPIGLFAGKEPAFRPDGFTFITDTAPGSFTYRIVGFIQFPLQMPTSASEAEERGWSLSWLGLESVRGCEPLLDPALIYALSGNLFQGLSLL